VDFFLDDYLYLVKHVLLAERLQSLLIFLCVAFKQVVNFGEGGHHGKFVVDEDRQYQEGRCEFFGRALKFR